MRIKTCLAICILLCLCVIINVANGGSACSDVTYVTRDEWNARDPKARVDMVNPLGFAVVHHTAGSECTTPDDCAQEVRNMQNYHMDGHGWDDIGYNLVIGGDERVYIGRGWDTVGAHAGSTFFNQNSVGITIIGDYTNKLPTDGVLRVLKQLLVCGVESGHLTEQYLLRGHRDVRESGPTACPGDTLYPEIQTWPHFLEQCPD
ncbi:peptidoglycan recognition protein 1-like [Patiria miniata]|uniref:Peptidoglycan-recognition protein n=1 Tax=Patiria miniata TaxID=46514 RepID=A0A914A756_PATMI|nr:peptidoglycan recognition protein 1-like [Patiria miniata]